MRSLLEWINYHQLLLPLVGAYYMWFSARKEQLKWRVPMFLGSVTWLSSWLMYGSADGMFMGLLYGLAVVGVAQYAYQGELSLSTLLQKEGSVLFRVLLGYLFFGVQIGVTALFWWVAGLLGGSYATEESFTLSRYPFLLPLAFAVAPALFEELVYRKFADAWLTKLTGSVWVAAIVSSLLWSFTHLGGGSVSPWYLRIIELGLIVGPLIFWLYRRYGLLPAVVSHFLYNVFMYDFQLVRSYGWNSAWVLLYVLLPLMLVPLHCGWQQKNGR